jgi:hypothetical protein
MAAQPASTFLKHRLAGRFAVMWLFNLIGIVDITSR